MRSPSGPRSRHWHRMTICGKKQSNSSNHSLFSHVASGRISSDIRIRSLAKSVYKDCTPQRACESRVVVMSCFDQAQEETPQTPKRRHGETDNDTQTEEIFQLVEGRKYKRTRPAPPQARGMTEETNQELDRIAHMPQRNDQSNHTTAGRNLRQSPARKPRAEKTPQGHTMTTYNSSTKNRARTFEQKEWEDRRKHTNGRCIREDEQGPAMAECKPHNQTNNVSQHALNYATSQHLPPFKINCEPAVRDQVENTTLINALFMFIRDDFKKMNKYCTRPIGFDTWCIDRQGALVCFTREIE